MPIDVFQKEHHDWKYKDVGQKAYNEHHIFVQSLVHAVWNTHFGLSERGKAPKYSDDQIFMQKLVFVEPTNLVRNLYIRTFKTLKYLLIVMWEIRQRRRVLNPH